MRKMRRSSKRIIIVIRSFPANSGISKNRKWTLDNTEMERDIISFIGSVAVQLRQENRELRARMKTMEKEWSASRKKAEEKESGKKNPLRKVVRGLKVKTTGR